MTLKPLLFLVTVSLRKALGSFLTEIFDCKPKVPCLARAMSADHGISLARIEGFFALKFPLETADYFHSGYPGDGGLTCFPHVVLTEWKKPGMCRAHL